MSKKNEVITAIDTVVTKGDDFLTKAKDFISCVELCSFTGSCPLVTIPADYWLILCLLITDLLPAPALFSVDVTCYTLLVQ